ncbi:apolipoprotein A-IV isoform X2 [Anguilla rostrata]|uniref:apolipoprotein A-IV isoform X2 n=1 Tax=Anguilla rostrata TaxID=7938 RepID=UPI0030CFCF3E
MHLKALVLVISFVATAGLPVPQNNDSTRPEASWDYSSQTANQAADKTELTKEAETWKSSLESSDLYGDLYAHDVSQSQGSLTGDLRRKLSLESQRLRARLAQELRELRERLAAAFAAHPTASLPPQRAPAAAARDRLALPAHRLRDALDSDARELCSALRRYAQGPETGGGPAPEPGATRYEDAARGMGRALGASESELTARLAEFQAEASGATGGQGGAAAALKAEVEAFGAGVRSRAESLRAGLAGTQSLGEGLSKHVEQFCRSSEEENRRFAGRIERQLEALGQGERGALSEGLGEALFVSPSSTGSLGEDFSPKLNALLQDILQTLS